MPEGPDDADGNLTEPDGPDDADGNLVEPDDTYDADGKPAEPDDTDDADGKAAEPDDTDDAHIMRFILDHVLSTRRKSLIHTFGTDWKSNVFDSIATSFLSTTLFPSLQEPDFLIY